MSVCTETIEDCEHSRSDIFAGFSPGDLSALADKTRTVPTKLKDKIFISSVASAFKISKPSNSVSA